MRTNIKPENRRLLEALDYLDDAVISSVLADVKVPAEGSPVRDKRATRRSIRYALALAACLFLISAVVPVVSYLTERFAAGSSKTYELTYPMFVAGLEPLSEEEMMKINEVYEDWKYGRLYESYVSSPIGGSANADQYARNELGDDPHRFFNKEKYNRYQYYGKFGDCVVLATENYFYTLSTFTVAGYVFELGGTADLIVYRNGEIMTLYEAYDGGYMTDAQIGEAHERYLAYQEYLNEPVVEGNKEYNIAETTEEELEIEIPEYTPPKPTDEPFYWYFFGKQSEEEEAFTRQEMLDIRAAYARYVFKNMYISVYKETMELWNSPDKAKERAFEHAKAEADYASSRFFRNNHIAERCYGWTGDRVILALLGKVNGETVFKAADNEMEFSCGTEMYVYENGEIFDFVEYRDRGGFTFDEELEIAVKHWIYEASIEIIVNDAIKDVTFTEPTEDYDLESYFGTSINNPIEVLAKFDDRLVVSTDTRLLLATMTYQVGAYTFVFSDFDLKVGYKGNTYALSSAYKRGILNDFEIAKIYELYLDYCEKEYQ